MPSELQSPHPDYHEQDDIYDPFFYNGINSDAYSDGSQTVSSILPFKYTIDVA